MTLFNRRSRENNGACREIEPRCNYYTMSRTLAASLLNGARRAIVQPGAVGWSGHWWRAATNELCSHDSGSNSKDARRSAGDRRQNSLVSWEVFLRWCSRAGFGVSELVEFQSLVRGHFTGLITDGHARRRINPTSRASVHVPEVISLESSISAEWITSKTWSKLHSIKCHMAIISVYVPLQMQQYIHVLVRAFNSHPV